MIVQDNQKKKIEYIANFINIYTTIYNYIICGENDSINAILLHGRIVDKNICVVFPASGFPYLTLCARQCKWKVATTYLAKRTKSN